MSPAPAGLQVHPVDGLGEVVEGSDLAALLDGVDLAHGDVVVVTSKVVSKAEGRVTDRPRDEVLAEETVAVLARRGPTTIARTHHGLVLAAAGIDASNVAPGRLVLLPRDPDGSARRLRAALAERRGVNVGVVVSDTAGRAWRLGQTDIAIGAAGVVVADDHAGRVDGYGNPLAVTLPALVDEVAGAAELATGKLSHRPVAVVRGLAAHVLPAGDDGPGAASLVRPADEDMFGLGAREAVVAALAAAVGADRAGSADSADSAGTAGAPAAVDDVLAALRPLLPAGVRAEAAPGPRVELVAADADRRVLGRLDVLVGALAAAHGWHAVPDGGPPVLHPGPGTAGG